jgi:hypothetical protein
VFNVAQRIKQVREVEARIKALEDELEEKIKPFEEFADKARAQILEHLNATGEKSAATEFGTAYWKPKTTYRVEDKESFMRHIIGSEEYGLATWAAAGVACEDFYEAHNKTPPPGLIRNSVRILYINAPAKPRAKRGNGADKTPSQAMADTIETL